MQVKEDLQHKLKVLIVDDNEEIRESLLFFVNGYEYEAIAAEDGVEAWKILQTVREPIIILSDWTMPRMDGIELCRRIRKELPRLLAYIIIFTGAKTEADHKNQTLEEGADAYLVKGDPQSFNILAASLTAGKNLLQRMQYLQRDELTGVWNSGAIHDRAHIELERSKRGGGPLSFIIVDIDYFKLVNDSLGHAAGNAVLTEMAQRIYKVIRPYDEVGRHEKGDEFFIICPNCDELGALAFGERIRNSIEENPFSTDAGDCTITVSIGVATLPPDEQLTAEELMRRADVALYVGKEEGRNRVNIFRPDLPQRKKTP